MIEFNIVYDIPKEDVPITKFKSKIILHKKNVLKVNPMYSNDVTCAQVTGVITDTWEKRGKRPDYRSWPSEGHVTVMEEGP